MRLLFLGDMVGRTGRKVVFDKLPGLIADHGIDFVIVNGENAAGGFGITEPILEETLDAGADVVTTGNHVWDQREALVFAGRQERFLRPANYPQGTPGRGMGVYEARNGARVMVSNILGRVFMAPDLDDPFGCAERQLEQVQLGRDVDCLVFDFHAEATSEKVSFAHFVDGRASLVVGTHTHVPTADHMIFDGGTAYLSDAGMCGDYSASLGMEKEEAINRFLTKIPKGRFEAAGGPATLCGLAVEVSDRTGLAEKVAPLRLGGRLERTMPDWW
ncbi:MULTISPECIES: TIGR00282 family metallophosphoesterase [unclassified Roseitalea]|uniref:TIGR00282 family metallophosphoesterase n=1 Tax=unclassified Roseitalea TaxID=2639107 RepID=UPI00273D5C6D|nr:MULTISPECIES: TIGR00282 family metallophosphoesterase [unclassified Roseitalea]